MKLMIKSKENTSWNLEEMMVVLTGKQTKNSEYVASGQFKKH